MIDARINELRCKPKGDTVRWLSAMHAIYDGNKDDGSRWLQGIQLLFSPDAGFLTTHNFKEHLLPAAPLFSENNYKGKFYENFLINSVAWERQLKEAPIHIYHKR